MAKKAVDPITAFLKEPRNLAIALEIDAHMPKIKDDLQREFWEACHRQLDEALRSQRAGERWHLAAIKKAALGPGYGIAVQPKPLPSKRQHLYFSIQQDGDIKLTVGVGWADASLVKELMKVLEVAGLYSAMASGTPHHHANWPGWVECEHYDGRNELLRTYVREGPALVREFVGEAAEFIERWADEVEKANAAIAGSGM